MLFKDLLFHLYIITYLYSIKYIIFLNQELEIRAVVRNEDSGQTCHEVLGGFLKKKKKKKKSSEGLKNYIYV